MNRVLLVIAAGAVLAVVGGIVLWSPGGANEGVEQAGSLPGSQRPDVGNVRPGAESVGGEVAAAIATQPFVPPKVDDPATVELDPKTHGYSKAQVALINLVRELLDQDVPYALLERRIDDAVCDSISRELQRCKQRMQLAHAKYLEAGGKLAEAEYTAGRYTVFVPQEVQVPDPRSPEKTITKKTSVFDGKREDEFISIRGAKGPTGERETQVVKLSPQTSEKFASVYLDNRSAVDIVRRDVRTILDSYLK